MSAKRKKNSAPRRVNIDNQVLSEFCQFVPEETLISQAENTTDKDTATNKEQPENNGKRKTIRSTSTQPAIKKSKLSPAPAPIHVPVPDIDTDHMNQVQEKTLIPDPVPDPDSVISKLLPVGVPEPNQSSQCSIPILHSKEHEMYIFRLKRSGQCLCFGNLNLTFTASVPFAKILSESGSDVKLNLQVFAESALLLRVKESGHCVHMAVEATPHLSNTVFSILMAKKDMKLFLPAVIEPQEDFPSSGDSPSDRGVSPNVTTITLELWAMESMCTSISSEKCIGQAATRALIESLHPDCFTEFNTRKLPSK